MSSETLVVCCICNTNVKEPVCCDSCDKSYHYHCAVEKFDINEDDIFVCCINNQVNDIRENSPIQSQVSINMEYNDEEYISSRSETEDSSVHKHSTVKSVKSSNYQENVGNTTGISSNYQENVGNATGTIYSNSLKDCNIHKNNFPDYSSQYNFNKLKPIENLDFSESKSINSLEELFEAQKNVFSQLNDNIKINNENLQYVYSVIESHNTRISKNSSDISSVKNDYFKLRSDFNIIKNDVNNHNTDIKYILECLENSNNSRNSVTVDPQNFQIENIPNSLILELKNRIEKINNIILLGLMEHNNPKIDNKKIISILRSIDINTNYIKFYRIGRKSNDKNRPILIKMNNRHYVTEALKKANTLPKGLILTSDLTKAQRNNINSIKEKINSYNLNNNDKKTIKFLDGVPKAINLPIDQDYDRNKNKNSLSKIASLPRNKKFNSQLPITNDLPSTSFSSQILNPPSQDRIASNVNFLTQTDQPVPKKRGRKPKIIDQEIIRVPMTIDEVRLEKIKQQPKRKKKN